MCQETETFRKFYWDLIEWDDEFVARKGKITASRFISSVFGPIQFNHDLGGYVATVPANAKWKDFDLVAISTFAPEGGDPPDFTLHLKAPLANVASRLKTDGFNVVAGGTKTLDDFNGVYSLSITLVSDPSDPSVSLFGCGLR